MHRNIDIRQVRHFLDNLAASAARGNGVSCFTHMPRQATCHGDFANGAQFAVTIGFGDRDRFGAQRHAIAGVFKIAARDDFACIKQQRRADMKV